MRRMKSADIMGTQSWLARSESLSGRGGHLKTRFCINERDAAIAGNAQKLWGKNLQEK